MRVNQPAMMSLPLLWRASARTLLSAPSPDAKSTSTSAVSVGAGAMETFATALVLPNGLVTVSLYAPADSGDTAFRTRVEFVASGKGLPLNDHSKVGGGTQLASAYKVTVSPLVAD